MTRSVNKMVTTLQTALKKQPIVKAWLFGSYSRVEETPESDVDILVEYDPNSRISHDYLPNHGCPFRCGG